MSCPRIRSSAKRAAQVSAAALLFAGAATLLACSSPEEKFQQHLTRAEAFIEQGKLKEAVVELRSAQQVNPKSAEASFRIAGLMKQQGKLADAVFFYREAYRLDPARSEAALAEAGLLLGDDRERASLLIDDVMQRDPKNALARVRLSELALLDGKTDEALAQARVAVELAPQQGLYLQHLGRVHQARVRELRLRGEPVPDALREIAIVAFEQADAAEGPRWEYRLDIARAHRAWPGHDAEADAAYRRAVTLAVESRNEGADLAVLDEARVYAAQSKNVSLARWTLDTLTRVRPEQIQAWVDLARLESDAGGTPQDVFDRLLRQRKGDLDAHVAYATWLGLQGKPDAATAHLRQAIAGGLDEASTLGAIANLEFRLARIENARAVVDEMQRRHPAHARTRLAVAQLAITDGRLPEARQILGDYAASSDHVDALRMLAFVEMQLGNLPGATTALNRAVELSPGFVPGLALLQAQVQYESHDYAAAAQSYRRVARARALSEPMDRLRFARSLLESGKPEAGRRQLERLVAEPDAPLEATLELAYRDAADDPARARARLESALERAPADARIVEYLTILDVREGNPRRAIERLRPILESDTAPLALVLIRARLLAELEMWEPAEQDARRVFDGAPGLPGAAELLVSIYRSQHRLDAATGALEVAAKNDALGGAQLYLLGRLHAEAGHADRAIALFERALAKQPDLTAAKNDLAYELARAGRDLERALSLAQDAQKSSGDNPSIADTLGVIYLQKGLVEPAIEQHRYALELAESKRQPVALLHHHLGLALKAAHRIDEATRAFEQALAVDPDFPEAAQAKQEVEAMRAAQAASANPS